MKNINTQICTNPNINSFYMNFGTIDKERTNITNYYYTPFESKIDELIKLAGFEVIYFGGRFPKNDFNLNNYYTKKLLIFDPDPENGGAFRSEAETRCWRKIHELSHALTLTTINQKYGEGKRLGKLSLNETLRAIEWEYLTCLIQKTLSELIGIQISVQNFNRELNTLYLDAIHRAIYGTFIEPEELNFEPFKDHVLKIEEVLKITEDLYNKQNN